MVVFPTVPCWFTTVPYPIRHFYLSGKGTELNFSRIKLAVYEGFIVRVGVISLLIWVLVTFLAFLGTITRRVRRIVVWSVMFLAIFGAPVARWFGIRKFLTYRLAY